MALCRQKTGVVMRIRSFRTQGEIYGTEAESCVQVYQMKKVSGCRFLSRASFERTGIVLG